MSTSDVQTAWDNETYQEFRQTVVRLRKAAESAKEEEAEARSTYRAASQARAKAEAALFAAIDRFSAPSPLFDWAKSENGLPEPTRPSPVATVQPVTRETSLVDLVPSGPDLISEVARLRQARLYSVGDVLDRAASTPKKVSTGTTYVDGTATVYETLTAVPDLERATVLAIGDALIGANLKPGDPATTPEPEVKPKQTRKQTSASVKVCTPIQVPASEFPLGDPEPEPEYHPLPEGVTPQTLGAAYIAGSFGGKKRPPTVKPVEFDGRLWVVTAIEALDDGSVYHCLPLVPTITWLDTHTGITLRDKPGTDGTYEGMLQFWTGVRVKVGKREFGIDAASEGRVIAVRKTPAPAAEPEQDAPTESAAFKGEYIGNLVGHGETIEQLRKKIEAALICVKFERPPKEPVAVRPFALRGGADLYVCTDATHQYGHSSYRAFKLYDPDSFKSKFPGRELRLWPAFRDGDPERINSYWGVRVKAAGKKGGELIIGPVCEGRQLTTYPGKESAIMPAGKCRVCGCVESDCTICVERTGEPCEWTSPAKDLCSACKPLLQETVAVLKLRKQVVELLEASGLVTIGHLHGMALDRLATVIGGRDPDKSAQGVLDAASDWLHDQFRRTDDGTEMPPDDRGKPDQEADTCCRCTRVGGAVVDDHALADRDDDLVSLDNLDMAIVDALGISVEDAEGAMLCAVCLAKVTKEITFGSEEQPKKKRTKNGE